MSPSPAKPETPFWLNKSLFKDILAKDYENARIVAFSAKSASGNGENYASVLYRINLTLESDSTKLAQRRFMVKVNHASGFGVQMAKMLQLFPKEISMYTELLPTFEKYFADVGETVRVGPKCLLGETEPREIIIMEDISVEGFKVVDRQVGLDEEHLDLTLQLLAKYHAASAYHYQQTGPYSPHFKYGMVNENFAGARDNSPLYKMLKGFYKDLKCYPLLEKLFDNEAKLISKASIDAVRVKEDRFNVLCHGDLWTNNLMFRYNEDTGKVEQCMLVDFQMGHYGSPMADLHYFITNSLTREAKVNKVDYVLHLYHKYLVKSLKTLGYKQKIPTLLELQMDFLDTGAYGMFSLLMVLPVISAPPSEESTVDNLVSTDDSVVEVKRRIYTNPTYLETLEILLPYYEQKGYLEL